MFDHVVCALPVCHVQLHSSSSLCLFWFFPNSCLVHPRLASSGDLRTRTGSLVRGRGPDHSHHSTRAQVRASRLHKVDWCCMGLEIGGPVLDTKRAWRRAGAYLPTTSSISIDRIALAVTAVSFPHAHWQGPRVGRLPAGLSLLLDGRRRLHDLRCHLLHGHLRRLFAPSSLTSTATTSITAPSSSMASARTFDAKGARNTENAMHRRLRRVLRGTQKRDPLEEIAQKRAHWS